MKELFKETKFHIIRTLVIVFSTDSKINFQISHQGFRLSTVSMYDSLFKEQP